MATLSNAEAVQSITRVSQIIVGAMVGGLLFFLAMVLVIGRDEPPADWNGPTGPPMLTVVAFFIASAGLVLTFLAPSFVVAKGLKRLARLGPEDLAMQDPWKEGGALPATDVGALLQLFQTQTIIAAALAEGPAFLALIAYMIDGGPLPLGISGLLIVAMMVRFPTIDRVHVWLDEQLARLNRLRAERPL